VATTLATVLFVILPVFVVLASLAAKGIDQYLIAQNWLDTGRWKELAHHHLVADAANWIEARIAMLDLAPDAMREKILAESRPKTSLVVHINAGSARPSPG
jgi:hypothetical protein